MKSYPQKSHLPILVTGANGLLATHIIKTFLDSGYSIKGLLRDRSKFVLPPHPNLELVEGSFTDAPLVSQCLEGCSGLIHSAAMTAPEGLRYWEYEKVNVEGTRVLLEAAVAKKAPKFLYVGTANSFGYGNKSHPGIETTPPMAPFTDSFYAQSKIAGERLALTYTDRLRVCTANPTFMIGAYDSKPSSGKILLMANREWVFHPPGGKNFVNAADVAQGILAIWENGKNGRSYLLAGENLSYREFFAKVEQQLGRPKRMVQIPTSILLLAGHVGNLLRKLGVRTPVSLPNMRILCVSNYYSATRAKGELGIRFSGIDKGIREALDWFQRT